ncbi:MAG: hypothetical protein E6306_06915, partial [Enterobacter sp.]|uniref:hypothetical protein n=1 Tax=Enterobacter sp. TaxID=42895 RepID=UPI00290C16F8
KSRVAASPYPAYKWLERVGRVSVSATRLCFRLRDSPRYPAVKTAPSINVWVATKAEQVEQDVKKPGGGFVLGYVTLRDILQ